VRRIRNTKYQAAHRPNLRGEKLERTRNRNSQGTARQRIYAGFSSHSKTKSRIVTKAKRNPP